MPHHYLIAYDIVDAKRRRKCAKVAYAYALGGQKSALETVLEKKDLVDICEEIAQIIDEDEDRVHLIHVHFKAILLGRAKQIDFDDGVILL